MAITVINLNKWKKVFNYNYFHRFDKNYFFKKTMYLEKIHFYCKLCQVLERRIDRFINLL